MLNIRKFVNCLIHDNFPLCFAEPDTCNGILCVLSKTLVMCVEECQVIFPESFLDRLKRNSIYDGDLQEDQHQFLGFLLQTLDLEYVERGIYAKASGVPVLLSPINRLFGCEINTQLRCESCKAVSSNVEFFREISLSLEEHVNCLDEALRVYFTTEKIPNYECKCSKVRTIGEKRIFFESCPEVLILTIKLFSFSQQGKKINFHISFPENLNLNKFYKPNKSGLFLEYKLSSVVSHLGSSLEDGHYTVACCKLDSTYTDFNDTHLVDITWRDVREKQAYVLVYEKRESQVTVHQTAEVVLWKNR